MNTCYVSLPQKAKTASIIYEEVILPVLNKVGFSAVRADQLPFENTISTSIWRAINDADIVLVDVTKKDPNTFYELGIAHGMGKPTVLVSQDIKNVPSDLLHYNILTYKQKLSDLERFKDRLQYALLSSIKTSSRTQYSKPSKDDSLHAVDPSIVEQFIAQASESRDNGNLQEAVNLYRQAIRLSLDNNNDVSAGNALAALGNVYQDLGDYSASLETLQSALEIWKKYDDPHKQAVIYANLANVFQEIGDLDRAEEFYRRSLNISDSLKDASLHASLLGNLANLNARRNDFKTAESYYRKAIKGFDSLGDAHAKATTNVNLATLKESAGDLEQAQRLLSEASFIFSKLGDDLALARTQHNLASVLIDQGDEQEAIRLLQESLKIKEKVGDLSGLGASLHNLALLELNNNNPEQGLKYLLEALDINRRSNDKYGLFRTLLLLGRMFEGANRTEETYRFVKEAYELARELKVSEVKEIKQWLSKLEKDATISTEGDSDG